MVLVEGNKIPSTGLQSQLETILCTPSVTAQFLLPTLMVRIASSAACQAAFTTSARRPVAGFAAVAPTTSVSALMAAKPSMCAPSWILTTSSLARTCDDRGSDLREIFSMGKWRGITVIADFIVLEGRKVCHRVVDGDAGGERETLFLARIRRSQRKLSAN